LRYPHRTSGALLVDNLDTQPVRRDIQTHLPLQRGKPWAILYRGFHQSGNLAHTRRLAVHDLAAQSLQIDLLAGGIHLAVLHVSNGSREGISTALDDAGTVSGARPSSKRYLQWILEVRGNTLQIPLRGRTQQPHDQKKRHHGGHKIGISDLPGRTVVTSMCNFSYPLDDDGLLLATGTGHGILLVSQAALRPLTWFSSSEKLGRSAE